MMEENEKRDHTFWLCSARVPMKRFFDYFKKNKKN